MRALRVFVLLAGLVLLAVAVALPFRQVTTASGYRCGTGWHYAGNRIAGDTDDGAYQVLSTTCKVPAERDLRRAGALGGGGVVLLILVAAWPARRWRPPDVVPAQI